MRVLIVGGTGFIGERLARTIGDRAEVVVGLDPSPPDEDPEQGDAREGLEYVEGTVLDRSLLERVMDEYGITHVVNLAYLLAAESEQDPSRAVRVNVVGMDNVFDVSVRQGVTRVVYTNSIAVYGAPSNGLEPATEDTIPPAAYGQYPLLLYSATKQLNEYQAAQYRDQHGLSIISVRPGVVFGPGRTSGLSKWASEMISRPARGEKVQLPLLPDQPVCLTYREDVVDLLIRCLEAETPRHDVYNTGGHRVLASKLATLIEQEIGGRVSCDPEARPLPIVSDVPHDRAKRDFDYELTPLKEAIREHARESSNGGG